ncbi:MAG: hypothetical protein SGI89_07505 [bacterium]|nr:hypothetical protein [bacterium]
MLCSLRSLEENIGGIDVEFTSDELKEIRHTASKIDKRVTNILKACRKPLTGDLLLFSLVSKISQDKFVK